MREERNGKREALRLYSAVITTAAITMFASYLTVGRNTISKEDLRQAIQEAQGYTLKDISEIKVKVDLNTNSIEAMREKLAAMEQEQKDNRKP